MKKPVRGLALLIAIVALMLVFQVAFAHTSITVGDYEVEVGWQDEPPVVGQRNAIAVNVSNSTAPDAEVDVSKLTVTASYGGETKDLTLEPLSEESSNQYIAAILPTIAGQYTVHLGGQLDSTDVDVDVEPEEVVPADELAFPSAGVEAAGAASSSTWLGVAGLIVGLAALVVALMAMRRAR